MHACRRSTPRTEASGPGLGLGALALALSLGLAACGEEQAPEPAAPRPLAWTEATRYSAGETRTLPGVLQAIQRAPLSFEVGGRVEAVEVEIGEHFETGRTLASLDPRTYELTLEERRGALAEAQARLREARQEFQRRKQLHGEGWVSQAAYDRALSSLETARSQVDTAQARVAIAEEDLADTRLTAPYDGTLAARHIEPSQRVQAGEVALEVQGNGGGLEAEVAAPETIVDRLEVGTRHAVRLPARPRLELTGIVSEIGSEADARQAYPVTLRIEGAPADLRAGMTAEVRFALPTLAVDSLPDVDEAELVAIPVSAFMAGPKQGSVAFVYDEGSGTVHRREIRVADVSDDTALVSEGLRPGEIVATKGLPFLSDGQQVVRLGVGPDRYNR